MVTVKNMVTLKALPSTPKEGELALLSETQEVYCYTKGEWVPVKAEGGMNASLYDINATAISQLPAHDKDLMRLAEDMRMIDDFIEDFDGRYFSLLCKQLSNGAFYNTIFYRNWTAEETMGQAVISCLKKVGTLHAVSNEETHLEFWIKEPDDTMSCFLFFNSDSMVIEVK